MFGFATAALADDPSVPPGRDPGGRAVAWIGEGVDYTAIDIAPKLARDGEGELIGYDFVDQDRKPFAASQAPSDISAMRLLFAEGQTATLIPIRIDLTKLDRVAEAIEYAVKTPAKVTVITGPQTAREMRPLLVAVSKLFPQHLFIVPAGEGGFDLDAAAQTDAYDLPNVLIVTAVADGAKHIANTNYGANAVDIAVVVATTSDPGTQPRPAGSASATTVASARAAAMAIRLAAVAPDLAPADIKTQIVSLAEPWGSGTNVSKHAISRAGRINQAEKPWFLE